MCPTPVATSDMLLRVNRLGVEGQLDEWAAGKPVAQVEVGAARGLDALDEDSQDVSRQLAGSPTSRSSSDYHISD